MPHHLAINYKNLDYEIETVFHTMQSICEYTRSTIRISITRLKPIFVYPNLVSNHDQL